MNDGIIRGTGNSRYLKSVSDFLSKYPDYIAFAQALIAGTLPIDLNGINAAGWTQQGTALNTANLLSASTSSALGGAATPDAAFQKLNSLVSAAQSTANGKAQIATGSYAGDGTVYTSASKQKTIQFPFAPKLVIIETAYPGGGASTLKFTGKEIRGLGDNVYDTSSCIIIPGSANSVVVKAGYASGSSDMDCILRITWSGTAMQYYADSYSTQASASSYVGAAGCLNQANRTYYWTAIG